MKRLVVAVALVAGACGQPAERTTPLTKPKPAAVAEPDLICPGDEGCASTAATDPLFAGAAARTITPTEFEIANPNWLGNDRPNYCAPEAPIAPGTERRCGELLDGHYRDCGRDGVCFDDEGYVGPDADGSERDDDKTDWFFDCGVDRLCPDNVPEDAAVSANGFDDDGDGAIDDGAYPGPDFGEGDGEFQGLWIAGYGNNRPAMGVKDDLEVRAIVFRQGDTTLAIVTVDAVGLFYDEQERMRAQLEADRPGEVDLLLVQASHTHEAPDTMGQWGYINPARGLQEGHGRSDKHMQRIREAGAAAVAEALDELTQVQVRVGVVNPGIEGLVHDGRDPNLYNDAITGISVEALDGTVVATLASWGNHPESLDSRNNFISSDYVGAIRDALEDGLPATTDWQGHEARGGVGIYLQGAVGGIMGPNHFTIVGRDGTEYENDIKTFARTDAYGQRIAQYALDAIQNGEVLAAPALTFSSKSYTAPVENQAFHVGIFNGWFDRQVFDFDANEVIGPGNYPSLKTAVAVVRLGEIGWVTAPGELFPETFVGYGAENAHGGDVVTPDNENPPDMSKAPTTPPLRDLLHVTYAMPLALCQDEIGYLVPPFDFKLAETGPYIDEAPGDHYEETNSIGPQAVPLLLEHLGTLFDFENGR